MAKDVDLSIKIKSDSKQAGQDINQLKNALIGIGVSAEKAEAMAGGIADELRQLAPAKQGVDQLKQSFIGLGLSEKEADTAARETVKSLRALNDEASKTQANTEASSQGFLTLANSIKAIAGAEVVRRFISTNAEMESLSLTLESITGSAESAAEMMDFLSSEAGRLGVDVQSAASSFKVLAASTKGTALEGQATRDIWSQVVEVMARLGATSADIEGAMTQLAQGASKGKFELEDLKSIAERIPGFFGKASAALGVTTAEFYEMVSAGQITADLLPQIARSLGATGGAVTSFNAQMSRLKNSFTDLFTAIGDTGVFDAIGFAVTKLAQSTQILANSLGVINKILFGTREQATKAAQKLADSAKSLIGIKPPAEEASKSLKDVGAAGLQAGEDIAAGMGKAAGAMDDYKKLTEQLSKDLKLLGVDEQSIDQLTGQLEDQLVQGFQRIADNPAARGQKVFQAFLSAVNGVELRGNLERLKTALYDTFRDGKITADQMAASLNAINTKSAGMWKNLTDSALAEQKRLEAGLDASLKRREQVETDFARRREKINEPENNDEATFGKLFDLQSKARDLATQAGKATGEEARRLSESALAMANKAADVVQQLNDSGKASDIEATGLLRGVETVAKQAADGLKNVPISIDTSKAQDQAREFLQVFQQYLEQNPVRVRVETSDSGDVSATLRNAALQAGGRR